MKCAAVEVEAVKNMLLDFPLPQQEAVGACIEAAKKKGGTGQRCTITTIWLSSNSYFYEYMMFSVQQCCPS